VRRTASRRSKPSPARHAPAQRRTSCLRRDARAPGHAAPPRRSGRDSCMLSDSAGRAAGGSRDGGRQRRVAPHQYLERREIRLVARDRVQHDDLGRDGHPRHGTLEHQLGGGRRGRWAASVYEHLSRTSTHARLTAAALLRE
jgi:hypothetical protein